VSHSPNPISWRDNRHDEEEIRTRRRRTLPACAYELQVELVKLQRELIAGGEAGLVILEAATPRARTAR